MIRQASSVNNTYLSNHTLELIGKSCDVGSPTDQVHDHVRDLLRMRKIANSKEVAMRKIFQSHPDLDMEPFFEWGLKFLPVAISWFERAKSNGMLCGRMLKRRELSAVYKFIRGTTMVAKVLAAVRKEKEVYPYVIMRSHKPCFYVHVANIGFNATQRTLVMR